METKRTAKFNGKVWAITANARTVTFAAQDGEIIKLTRASALRLIAQLRQLTA